ncbi:transcription termination/antitermination protein NusG, partial [Candidatus Roizmanbacteria bacterium]|nr:transcription termination/antitermination protein NusG [Candidatus Roizmanbacteria bacterium]
MDDQSAKTQPQIVAEEVRAASVTHPNAKWYVIHIQTGYENKVKQALEQRIKSLGVEEKIFDVVIPVREII